MSQPVKLSDQMVLDARLVAEASERSIAGQIEYWAQLGRAIEPHLKGSQALALRRSGTNLKISDCLQAVGTREGQSRLSEHLQNQPFPHYQATLEHQGLLLRTDQDGTQTLGRFVNRRFVPHYP